MATETSLRGKLADEFYAAFEVAERTDGAKFYKLRKGHAPWMGDAIREAHNIGGDTILPNDWVYDACHTIISNMTDTDPDDWEDSIHEWADGAVDVYNSDRASWLASHLRFGTAVDEAVAEMGESSDGVYGNIGIGQFYVLSQIAATLVRAVNDAADEVAEDQDE